MPLDESDAALLWDILRHALIIERFVKEMTEETYLSDERTRFAIERLVEIVGEAAHRLSETARQFAPEIPWPKIVGQRNVLAHEYGVVNHNRLWIVATQRIPELIQAVERILAEQAPDAS